MKPIEAEEVKAPFQPLPLAEPKLVPKGKISFEEFLAWSDEDTWAEWVDGEVILMSAASSQHQQIKGFLYKVLGLYIETRGLGLLLDAPFAVRLPVVHRAPEPDLLYIAAENLSRLKKTYLDGPADVIVEIVSEESIQRDYERKFSEYALAGVPEYWLIDPLKEEVMCYHLSGQGDYERLPMAEDGTMFRSQEIAGFWFRVDWLWEMPLPDTFSVLHQLMPDMQAEALRREIKARQQAEIRARQEAAARRQEAFARRQAEQRAEQAEAELDRLRAELEALRTGKGES